MPRFSMGISTRTTRFAQVSGTIEQWIDNEVRRLTVGDVAFIPKNTVHATFVDPDEPEQVRLFVTLSPSHGPDGYEAVDVSDQDPWNALR